jgi:hypothetical protein
MTVLAATGLLLAGCSGAHSAATRNAPLTKAQAVAYARAVNLRASDMPGMTQTAPEGPSNESRSSEELRRCAGLGPEHGIVDIHSATFQGPESVGYEKVRSGVTVQPTPALASEGIAAAASPRGRACIAHFAQSQYSGKEANGVRLGQVGVTSLPVSSGHGFKTVGVQVTIHTTVTRGSGSVPVIFYLDLLGFALGPAEVDLLAQGAPEPFPRATEERLMSTLMGRALTTQVR